MHQLLLFWAISENQITNFYLIMVQFRIADYIIQLSGLLMIKRFAIDNFISLISLCNRLSIVKLFNNDQVAAIEFLVMFCKNIKNIRNKYNPCVNETYILTIGSLQIRMQVYLMPEKRKKIPNITTSWMDYFHIIKDSRFLLST